MPDRHARSPGARDFDQGAQELLTKQNALSGNRCQMTEPVYKVIHQFMVHAGRAIGDGLSPASDGQLENGTLAQDQPLTRSRTTAAGIPTELEMLKVGTDSKRIKILCNGSSRKNSN
jgi:hypothetical protein